MLITVTLKPYIFFLEKLIVMVEVQSNWIDSIWDDSLENLKRTCYFWIKSSIKNIDCILAFHCLFYTRFFLLTFTQCFAGKGINHFRLCLRIPRKLEGARANCYTWVLWLVNFIRTTCLLVNSEMHCKN